MESLTKCNAREPEDQDVCKYYLDGQLCAINNKCYWGPYKPEEVPCEDEIDPITGEVIEREVNPGLEPTPKDKETFDF